MDDFEELIQKELEKVPHTFFKKLLENKLKEAGVKPSSRLINKLYDHITNDNDGAFKLRSIKNATINLKFTDEELENVSNKLSDFLEVELPKIIQNTSNDIAKILFSDLKKKWNKEYKLQTSESNKFKKRLERRWRKPLGLLRMLLTISMELGSSYTSKYQGSEFEKSSLYNVLVRLHCRACQVTAEIITLLENGYADGAMARWRTLHEITTVAFVINHYGEDIAERYLAHEAVENKGAVEDYTKHAVKKLGYEPISDDEKASALAEYNAVIEKYGKSFAFHYGWASHHLNTNRVTLFDLEEIAEKDSMRSHYQMASYNVHASVKGILFRLSNLDEENDAISGASTAGLDEAGIHTASTLCQINTLVIGDLENINFENVTYLHVIVAIRDEITESFQDTSQKLQKDYLEYKRELCEYIT